MKTFFATFGCRVNQYETQVLRERVLAGGSAKAVADWRSADLCLINTCTVTQGADSDALKLVRRIARSNPAARLVVTGCLATRDPGALSREAPGAVIVGNGEKTSIPAMLGCELVPAGVTGFHGHARAFVKVQDGCDMRCAYCIIPKVRPELSSKSYKKLEEEVRGLIARGRREIVLCGVRLGRYLDRKGAGGKQVDFVGMLGRLSALPGDFRIRLSSLEVTDLTDRFIRVMESSGGRIAPSLHIPLQSGSDTVLKRMRRWYASAFYARRVAALRARIPGLGIFTDVMAGFPGETEAEHSDSLDFIRGMGFSGLHVFRYSPRPGTPAAAEKPVPEKVVRSRAGGLRGLSVELGSRFAAGAVGAERTLVMEMEGSAPAGVQSSAPSGSLLGPQGVAEDFLKVTLTTHPGPGFVRVRVTRSEGPRAFGVPIGPEGS